MSDAADDARLDRLDYYTLLGVKRDAGPDDVREGFRRFAQRYHPDVYAGKPAETVSRATRIYRRGTEAYRVLLDPTLRRRYDDQLALGKLRYEPTALSEKEIVRRSIPPQLMPAARAAQQAMKGGDHALAMKLLREALAQDPHNPILLGALDEVRLRASKPPPTE